MSNSLTYKRAVGILLLDNRGEWIDSKQFTDVGGRGGDRRLREFRADAGWDIRTRRSPENARLFQYRLAKSPGKRVSNYVRYGSATAKA